MTASNLKRSAHISMSSDAGFRLPQTAGCASNVSASLASYITSRLQTPFAWGTHDCVCFAIGWVSIATGKDLLAPWRPWDSELQAHRLIRKAGGLACVFDKLFKRIPANTARDGDIALIGDTVFLFSGAQIVGPSKNGLVFRNRMEAACAWSY